MAKWNNIVFGFLGGTAVFFAALLLIDDAFWFECGGKDIHLWSSIFICWHVREITAFGSLVAGFVAGVLSKRHGMALGVGVALAGGSLFSCLVRYPFGSDNLLALQWGLLLYVLPSCFASVVGARLAGDSWRNAL